jgi:hypothetical protein
MQIEWKMSALKAALAFSLLASAEACVAGGVVDASSGNPLNGVTVTLVGGLCNTATHADCPSYSQVTKHVDVEGYAWDGVFVFDAYGPINGTGNVQRIAPDGDDEAMLLRFSRSGYQTVDVYHRVDFTVVRDSNNKPYQVSAVPTVYLCPNGAPDTDADGLCDLAEARFGTSASSADTDGDGITDKVEVYGAHHVDLRYYGGHPRRKDVFVELDYYPNSKPAQAAVTKQAQAFANAPVVNHDGSTGVRYHGVIDSEITATDAVTPLPTREDNWQTVDAIKAEYQPANRSRYFYYSLTVDHTYEGYQGIARAITAHDYVVALGTSATPGGTETEQAGVHMHELGHALGLRHGGNENTNFKANYFSIMNYAYTTTGVVRNNTYVLDYSRMTVAPISETSVNELTALDPIAPTTDAELGTYSVILTYPRAWQPFVKYMPPGRANANLDFNTNGVLQSASYAHDLTGDGAPIDSLPASQNDWKAITYGGGGTIGGALASVAFAPNPAPVPEGCKF